MILDYKKFKNEVDTQHSGMVQINKKYPTKLLLGGINLLNCHDF